MTIACSEIIARAQAFSPLNGPLVTDTAEMLSRIRADQKAIFTSVAAEAIDFFQASQTLTSSGGSSGRTIDLTALTLPLERILTATLQDGRLLSAVHPMDTDAELSPRYTVRSTNLVEVGNDWGASGQKQATILYVYGPVDITPTGGTTQNVSLPDQWTDLLVIPLAMYLHTKDPGRPPEELETLSNMNDEKQAAFMSYLRVYGGIESQRFIVPTPLVNSKKA